MTRAKLQAVVTRPPSTDAKALARIAEGDLGALGELYDTFAPSLLRFAVRVAGRDDAEDVVQTVFIRVARVAHTFDSEASTARPWLFAITARVALERRRSLRRFAVARLKLSAHAAHSVGGEAEARSDVERALGRLPAAKRTVLVLAEVEGFTCDEIARMLSIPVGTVWTRLHHARRELRRFCDEGA